MDQAPSASPVEAPTETEVKPQETVTGALHFTLSSASHEEQGLRPTMEDAHIHLDELHNTTDPALKSSYSQLAFYAVYDGHGGDQVAKMVAQQLHPAVIGHKNFSEDVQAALTEGFASVDKGVVELCNNNSWMIGTTAVVGVIVDGKLVVANVGDSEAIAISIINGQAEPIEMTTPHKATDQSEKSRIEALGGHVFLGRVFGSLAVTRAFGDSKFKTPKMAKDFVSVEPAFHELVLTPAHQYILFACDGLWDVMTHKEAASFVHQKASENTAIQTIVNDIVAEALKRGSSDNVTAIVVKLHWSGEAEWTLEGYWESINVSKSLAEFGAVYDSIDVLGSLSKSYDEINISQSLSETAAEWGKAYDEIRIADSISETTAEWGKAYDNLDVAKSLGEFYDEIDVAKSLSNYFPSLFGKKQTAAPTPSTPATDTKPAESTENTPK